MPDQPCPAGTAQERRRWVALQLETAALLEERARRAGTSAAATLLRRRAVERRRRVYEAVHRARWGLAAGPPVR